MPIKSPDDAIEVEERITRIFDASTDERATEVRALFVEVLDFDTATGHVDLGAAPANVALPASAERVASLDGVHVVYLALDTPESDRVRKAEAAAAARLIAQQLGGDLLLVVTNSSASQLHLVHPSFAGAWPVLRRMVVERDLPRRTAVQQVSNIYWKRRETRSIQTALFEAFDVEPVTFEFFKEYKRVFETAEESITGFGNDKEARHRFVQTLFNRLMFIYFLSRKGWLTFKDDKDYLNALWRDYRAAEGEEKNFYIDRLRLLFFAGLNNLPSEDLTSAPEAQRLIGNVPFLNGGLFDMNEEDVRTGVIVPDECISQIFTELFDRFNFTVLESTPFDIEVAVDPEMLGKVFEELVTGRHDSGAYYTPRPVVSFMCREAIKGYIEGQDTGVAPEAIARFVDDRDTSGISSVASARMVAQALYEVTVVDPACGSGAYLLGMMQELVELQTALFNVGADAKGIYELKLNIIQNNLYGVDIDDFAVNIAMLRMWLSLAIDFEGEHPPPLPNLDFKVLRGDSLLGPNPSADSYGDMFRHRAQDVAARLAELKAQHMAATTGKETLRSEIERVQDELKEALADAPSPQGATDWRVEFAEVFTQRGGFDIAIANPPYVRQEDIGVNKATLVKQYSEAATARSDLYCYFYARALQVLRHGGMHVFVCSNSWLDVGYGAKLQEYLLRYAHIRAVYESAVERQFSTADINTIISLIRNGHRDDADQTRFVSLRGQFDAAIVEPSLCREIWLSRADMRASGTRDGKWQGDKWGGKYLRAPDIYHYILDKSRDKIVRLGDVATVRFGIKTGANKFFYLTPERIREFGIELQFMRPVMTSPQESRRIAVDPEKLPHRLFLCHEDKEALAGTGALEYIRYGEEQGYHTRSSVRSRGRWYDLGDWNKMQLAMNKLVHTTVRTFLAQDGALFTDNFQFMTNSRNIRPGSLCAAMNSTFFQLIINVEARSNFGQGVLEIQTYETSNAPIVSPTLLSEPGAATFNSAEWDVLNPSAERRQIDESVFDALGLTKGERDAVYESVSELVTNRKRRAQSA